MALVDFTNPAATKWYTDKLRTLLDMGVDCFKTDFGERIPVDVTYHNGADPVSMHNYYTFLYNQAVFTLLKEVKGKEKRFFCKKCHSRRPAVPGTLGRRLFRNLSIHGRDAAGRSEFCNEWIFLLES